jgi:hypothetical protein
MVELEEDGGAARLPSSSEMSGEKRHDTGTRKKRRETRDRVPNRKVRLYFWIMGSAQSKMKKAFGADVEDDSADFYPFWRLGCRLNSIRIWTHFRVQLELLLEHLSHWDPDLRF